MQRVQNQIENHQRASNRHGSVQICVRSLTGETELARLLGSVDTQRIIFAGRKLNDRDKSCQILATYRIRLFTLSEGIEGADFVAIDAIHLM